MCEIANGVLTLNDSAMEFLNSAEISALPVVIFGGHLISGKSFFLNQILKYCRNECLPQWNREFKCNGKFQWKGDELPVTSGILIWERPEWGTMGSVEYIKNHLLSGTTIYDETYMGCWRKKPVAVRKLACDQILQGRFHAEICKLKQLRKHPNVTTFYHSESTTKQSFVIVQEISSLSLAACVNTKYFPMCKNSIVSQIATGLQFLHRNDIIHRNLKPSNILISLWEDGRATVKLSDFGISKVFEETMLCRKPRSFGNSFNWFAPEILRQYDFIKAGTSETLTQCCKSDIFSFGCVLHYVLTEGKHPFGNGIRCGTNILDGKITFLETPETIKNISLIKSMLARNTIDRPSCHQVLSILTTSDTESSEDIYGGSGGGQIAPMSCLCVEVCSILHPECVDLPAYECNSYHQGLKISDVSKKAHFNMKDVSRNRSVPGKNSSLRYGHVLKEKRQPEASNIFHAAETQCIPQPRDSMKQPKIKTADVSLRSCDKSMELCIGFEANCTKSVEHN